MTLNNCLVSRHKSISSTQCQSIISISQSSGTIKSLNHISNRSICKPNYQLCNNTYTNRQLCNFLSRGRIRIRVNEVLEVPSWNRNRIILLIISNNGLIAQAKNKLKPMDQTISSQQLSINHNSNQSITSKQQSINLIKISTNQSYLSTGRIQDPRFLILRMQIDKKKQRSDRVRYEP